MPSSVSRVTLASRVSLNTTSLLTLQTILTMPLLLPVTVLWAIGSSSAPPTVAGASDFVRDD
jgi:hypothetical protein